MPKIFPGFDGEVFARKFGLEWNAFYDDGQGNLVCPSLPNLTDADIADCIAVPLSHVPFDKPLKAPDFIVASPIVKADPLEALTEAMNEAKKAHGENKSIALIVLSLAKYIEYAEGERKKHAAEIETLKGKK